MLTVNVKMTQFDIGLTDRLAKQAPFALAQAMNDAVYDGQDAVEDEIAASFDRPTRFTKKAFRVQRASKRDLTASILRKDMVAGRHYLEVQEEGGARPQTGLEKLLARRLNYGGIVQSVIPAKGARLTAAGNWSPGQRNQVLSAIKAQRDERTNTTKASKARKTGRSGYFVPRDGSKLSPGVYQRMARGKVKKILHITDRVATYQKRFHFYERVSIRVNRKLAGHFDRRLKHALATAR